ncbi:MAG TPA: PAS domain S-box protein, partial [Candidatus Acidoferrales bacterium]|nr:PAS domain S-box protein [Candidatus Acidoferrales bacterium]
MSHAVKNTHQKIIDAIGDAVLIIDSEDYTILDANHQAALQFKLAPQELTGKTCHQIAHQRDTPCPQKSCPIRIASKNMKPYTVEHEHIDKNQNTYLAEITVIPLLTEERNTVVYISRDITERKQLIQKIEEDEKRYHTLFDQAPLGILIIDPQTAKPVEFNELAHQQLGYTREEFSKLTLLDYKAETTSEQLGKLLEKILAEGKVELEDKHKTKDGGIRDVIITSQVIELSGKIYLQSIYRDVTEAKQVERALMQSESMYRLLVENAREGIWALDGSNRTVYVNPKLAKMLHYSESEMHGKPLNMFLDNQDINVSKEGWEDYKKSNRSEYEFILKRKDGIRIFALVSFSPIEDDHGHFQGTLALVTDITLRRAMEEKLEAYSKTLEETIKQRTTELLEAQARLVKAERLAAIGEVAAMVGHDLRNPLTGINGAVFYLKKKLPANSASEILEMLDVIEKDIHYANAIVTDLMDYSREIKLDLGETTPQQLIKQSLAHVSIPENVKTADLSEQTPLMRVDVNKMQRVLANLLKNAVEA